MTSFSTRNSLKGKTCLRASWRTDTRRADALGEGYDAFVRSGALLRCEGQRQTAQAHREAGMLTLAILTELLKENKAIHPA
jgi:hypothetical protein